MGSAYIPKDVFSFSSVIYHEGVYRDKAVSGLESAFGDIAYTSPQIRFNYTPYYKDEMGTPLYRIIIAFDRLIPRDSLSDIKTITNTMETSLSVHGRRCINIDPGLISLENICLATTKPYSHRIYLKDGIWAEVTLMYKGGTYYKLDWTYPDYASEEMIGIFNHLRTIYKDKITCQKV